MIELKNITKTYKNKKIFDNFSLSISAGERVVLFAASGSGKTTLLHIIAGLEGIDSGSVVLDGVTVTEANKIIVAPHLRDIGMVFQDLALWPHLNVAQNIQLALKVKKIPKQTREKQTQEILQKLGLEGFEKKRVHELSGGEQQRVALARTLVLKPKIILMDEPLSSLDKALNIALREEILRLQKLYKFTLVYVTHNEEEAHFLATKIIHL